MTDSSTALLKQDEAIARLADKAYEIVDSAQKKPKTKRYTNVNVIREGVNITIPEHMALDEAIKWLKVQREAENREVNFHREFDAYPLDGARAVKLALETIYGYADVRGLPGLFGEQPPRWVELDMGDGELQQIPWGVLWPQGLDGFMSMGYKHEPDMKFILEGTCKAKDEKAFSVICDMVQAILRTDSIYRGKAFRLNFDWEKVKDEDGNVAKPDPLQLAPQIMDVEGLDRECLILNDLTKFQLETSVLLRLEASEACQISGVPLRTGVLFSGSYGTGKTLTARVIAKIAKDNNWTFIYLDDVRHLPRGARLAEMYAPAVLFAEDVDEVLKGDRDSDLNKILNVIDGIDTKKQPIMSILTTNRPERIQKGFLRAGRIDTFVKFEAPDAENAWRFVKLYTKDEDGLPLLNMSVSPEQREQICQMLAGMMPAFIAEVCKKAVLRAMFRLGDAPKAGDVIAEDLIQSARAMVAHCKLADEFDEYKEPQLTE